jgi:transposase
VQTPARANQVNKEAIRVLVLQHGQREAARIAGLNENTVRSWAMRYNWSTPNAATKTQPNGHSALVERISDELQENERETRLSLSRYARRASKDAESASLKDAPYVKAAAQVAGITHKWNDTNTTANHFTLNTLNITSIDVRPEPEEDNTQA